MHVSANVSQIIYVNVQYFVYIVWLCYDIKTSICLIPA